MAIKRFPLRTAAVATISLSLLLVASFATDGPEPRTDDTAVAVDSPAPLPAGVAHQVISIHPTTGRIVPASPDVLAGFQSDDLRAMTSTSHEGLVEEPSPVANGGTMIRLNGRFTSLSSVTVDANGQAVHHCGPGSQ
jgi:hypothetical protein